MKGIRVLLVLAISLLMFGSFQTASAGAFTYTSAYQVFNLEGTAASISIYFYNQDGTIKTTVPDSLNANAMKTYFVVVQLTTSFNGSIVISSTTQVASIANVHGNNYYANASYIAASSGGSPVQIPLLMKNNSGYSTWFNVQNTGLSDATVNVAYSDGTNVNGVVIKKGASHTYDQLLESHSLTSFAATVTSNQPVVVTAIEESSAMMFAYNGFGTSSTAPLMPIINANNSGYTTSLNIKNDGASSTSVTVSYTPSPGAGHGTACTETQTINAGQLKVFSLIAFANGANSTCTPRALFVGSAKVTANSGSMPLTVVVNQHILGKNGSAYGAFNSAAATSKVIFPLVMDRNANWWTGINVQNVGSSSTTVTCTFTGTSYQIGPTVLAVGAALNALQYNAIAAGYVGSGTCTATGGDAKIVGIVNELQNGGATDQLMTYEGINVQP